MTVIELTNTLRGNQKIVIKQPNSFKTETLYFGNHINRPILLDFKLIDNIKFNRFTGILTINLRRD